MADLFKLVEAKLVSRGDNETQVLWRAIWDSYEMGGPDAVEHGLLKQVKAAKSAATKEIRATKKVVPKRRAKKRRR